MYGLCQPSNMDLRVPAPTSGKAQATERAPSRRFYAPNFNRLLIVLAVFSRRLSFVIPKSSADPVTVTLTWLSALCVCVSVTSIAILYIRLSRLDVADLNERKFDSASLEGGNVRLIPYVWAISAVVIVMLSCLVALRPFSVAYQPTESQMLYVRLAAGCVGTISIMWTLLGRLDDGDDGLPESVHWRASADCDKD